jgi:hypothetical protein
LRTTCKRAGGCHGEQHPLLNVHAYAQPAGQHDYTEERTHSRRSMRSGTEGSDGYGQRTSTCRACIVGIGILGNKHEYRKCHLFSILDAITLSSRASNVADILTRFYGEWGNRPKGKTPTRAYTAAMNNSPTMPRTDLIAQCGGEGCLVY